MLIKNTKNLEIRCW